MAVALSALVAALVAASGAGSERVWTAFCSVCSAEGDWQAAVLVHSHRASGQPGGLTRLMACTAAGLARYHNDSSGDELLRDTFVYEPHAPLVSGEHFSPIDKPWGLLQWLDSPMFPAGAEFILVLERDMILRRPLTPAAVGAAKGKPASPTNPILVGVGRAPQPHAGAYLAQKFVSDAHAAASEAVGRLQLLHAQDLRAIARRWVELTAAVREHPERYWGTGVASDAPSGASPADLATGDSAPTRGEPTALAEMYGYAMAAAEAGLVHTQPRGALLIAGYPPEGTPLVVQYAAPFAVGQCRVDAHALGRFDALACTPLELRAAPPPKDLLRGVQAASEAEKLLYAYETAMSIRLALCAQLERHGCGGESLRECNATRRNTALRQSELLAAWRATKALTEGCQDNSAQCPRWASRGECTRNAIYMLQACRLSCKACEPGAQTADAAAAAAGAALADAAMAATAAAGDGADGLSAFELARATAGDEMKEMLRAKLQQRKSAARPQGGGAHHHPDGSPSAPRTNVTANATSGSAPHKHRRRLIHRVHRHSIASALPDVDFSDEGGEGAGEEREGGEEAEGGEEEEEEEGDGKEERSGSTPRDDASSPAAAAQPAARADPSEGIAKLASRGSVREESGGGSADTGGDDADDDADSVDESDAALQAVLNADVQPDESASARAAGVLSALRRGPASSADADAEVAEVAEEEEGALDDADEAAGGLESIEAEEAVQLPGGQDDDGVAAKAESGADGTRNHQHEQAADEPEPRADARGAGGKARKAAGALADLRGAGVAAAKQRASSASGMMLPALVLVGCCTCVAAGTLVSSARAHTGRRRWLKPSPSAHKHV